MTRAFVDTTVLTDAALKTGAPRESARRGLERFDETELPVYAIKEFRQGPLRNYARFHNELVNRGSVDEALRYVQRLVGTPRKYLPATALEAFIAAREEICRATQPSEAVLDGRMTVERYEFEQHRLALKRLIFRGWRKRRVLTTRVVEPLGCFGEAAPEELANGCIEVALSPCRGKPCSLAERMREDLDAVRLLHQTVKTLPEKPENTRRARALREVHRTPKRAIKQEGACRAIGDAAFAFLAPKDATILTTNVNDHEPLAAALGKKAETP